MYRGVAAAIGPVLIGISRVLKLIPMLSAGFTALLSPVGIITAAVLALAAAFAYAKIKKQELINETAEEGAPKVYAMIDKLAKIGVIHQNKAANLKSGIAVYINKLA